jgi:oxygen-dependent protoporphyrinogen oxidase
VAASAYRRADIAHALAGFGFLVPKKEGRRILGTLFSSSMYDGRAADGTVLLTTFIGGLRQPDLPGEPDAVLLPLLHSELAALVGARGQPQWAAVTRWTHAIPQYNLGHRDRLRPIEAAERDLPTVPERTTGVGGLSATASSRRM